MSNVRFKLNLNKHPKDCDDYSLISANNVRVSDDFSCLQSEESIIKNTVINDAIGSDILVGVIPCNKELVLFIVDNEDYNNIIDEGSNLNSTTNTRILRYNEDNNEVGTSYVGWEFSGGEIKGTFTYNINSDLIIAFAEYDANKDVPLKTINLGQWKIDNYEIVDDTKMPLVPEVNIPILRDFDYTYGQLYKGWYHFFIRYKIDKVDYTQWYNFGIPIFVCTLEFQNIIKYGHTFTYTDACYLNGCSDNFSSKTDIANETIILLLETLDSRYKYFQIGFACVSKDSTKAFRTNDIEISNNSWYEHVLNINYCVEASVSDFINSTYNYYNVRNIINYQNRLYISNYKENNDISDFSINADSIIVGIEESIYEYDDIFKRDIKSDSENIIYEEEEHIDSAESYDSTTPIYINTENSFTERKKLTTLIPGEVYSFYIHFVDKYGHATRGYKLKNTVKYRILNSDIDYFPIRVSMNNEYLLFPLESTIGESASNGIGTRFIRYDDFNNICYFEETIIYNGLDNINIDIDHLEKLGRLVDYKWYELYSAEIQYDIDDIYPFSYYKNNKGDILFKVPDSIIIGDLSKFVVKRFLPYFNLMSLRLPEGYVKYFISYEKFESTSKILGVATKADIFTYPSDDEDINKYINHNNLENSNLEAITFYSSKLDIADALDFGVNVIRLEYPYTIFGTRSTKEYDGQSKHLFVGKYPINLNKVEYSTIPLSGNNKDDYASELVYAHYIYLPIDKIRLNIAGDILYNRDGVGTCLTVYVDKERLPDIFKNEPGTDISINIRASLLHIDPSIYTNDEKILIRLGNEQPYSSTQRPPNVAHLQGNAFITYQGTLIYNTNKFIVEGHNIILSGQQYSYYPINNIDLDGRFYNPLRHPVFYLQQIAYDSLLYEAKSINNAPEILPLALDGISGEESKIMPFANNIIVIPTNSIDLFKEKYPDFNTLIPITYIANNENELYMNIFNKRIRRSNVIADEAIKNAWRSFPVEGYKDIYENKGKITNIVGVGLTFLVHTEHSLFMFNRDNTIEQNEESKLQLMMLDVFDLSYQEVFTSDLGMCGLQDSNAFIVGSFGYIFYDNDSHRFYKFGERKIDFIDNSIVQYLNTYILHNVRFANDKERNRIIIRYDTVENRVTYNRTISYNYAINEFISFHNYTFTKAYNTKNMLYYFMGIGKDSTKHSSKAYCILQDLQKYNRQNVIDNIRLYNEFQNIDSQSDKSFINEVTLAIIVNTNYNFIKTLDFISYKLFRRGDDRNHIYDSNKPIDCERTPYSGYQLRVYNSNIDTANIDIAIDSESDKNLSVMNYKKPYWEYGNWNFSYFRNKGGINGNIHHDLSSRLYGNYFIIWFSLNNLLSDYKQKIEFEDLNCELIVNKTI